jgi:hypothetical protein
MQRGKRRTCSYNIPHAPPPAEKLRPFAWLSVSGANERPLHQARGRETASGGFLNDGLVVCSSASSSSTYYCDTPLHAPCHPGFDCHLTGRLPTQVLTNHQSSHKSHRMPVVVYSSFDRQGMQQRVPPRELSSRIVGRSFMIPSTRKQQVTLTDPACSGVRSAAIATPRHRRRRTRIYRMPHKVPKTFPSR